MSNLLSFVFVAATSSTAFVAAQEKPAQTGQQDSVPSEFARFVKVADGGHFDTAITTYEKDGAQVVFYAAVHIADRACYQALNERFRGCDVLLYELVGEEDARPSKGQRSRGFNPVGVLQQALKNGLQLSFQLEEIDYQAKNFVHADMTPQEFQSSMAARGESLLSIMYDMMGESADKLREQSEGGSGQPDVDLVAAFRTGAGRHMMRMTFAQQLESMGLMAAGGEGSTLLEGRNEKCLKVLRRELAAGHDRIGIYYGAAHMPHMERRLVEDMGFRKVKHEWLQSWDCTRRADGDVALSEVSRRRACKLQLMRIAKVGKAWRSAKGADAAPPKDVRAIAKLQASGERAYEGPLEDPWGTLVRVELRRGKQLWQAVSAGPDKEFGTKDDLTMRERAW
ncbi:MAG: hypothetical protein VYA51_10030 [Planctomycetota bacterium]|nr:hypothetical protein [Planctomycetota bacterium]